MQKLDLKNIFDFANVENQLNNVPAKYQFKTAEFIDFLYRDCVKKGTLNAVYQKIITGLELEDEWLQIRFKNERKTREAMSNELTEEIAQQRILLIIGEDIIKSMEEVFFFSSEKSIHLVHIEKINQIEFEMI